MIVMVVAKTFMNLVDFCDGDGDFIADVGNNVINRLVFYGHSDSSDLGLC